MRAAIAKVLMQRARPDGDDDKVLAVMVEHLVHGGMDLIVVFADDEGARYYNFSGRAVVWNLRGDLAPQIEALLAAGRSLADSVGIEDDRKGPPFVQGDVRVSVYTGRGRRSGHGPLEAFADDPIGGPVVRNAFELMQALIAKAPR